MIALLFKADIFFPAVKVHGSGFPSPLKLPACGITARIWSNRHSDHNCMFCTVLAVLKSQSLWHIKVALHIAKFLPESHLLVQICKKRKPMDASWCLLGIHMRFALHWNVVRINYCLWYSAENTNTLTIMAYYHSAYRFSVRTYATYETAYAIKMLQCKLAQYICKVIRGH